MSNKSRRTNKSPAVQAPESVGERLQKVLAAAGIGSRRECEQLIEDGRVEVDRSVVVELGTRVDAESQDIRVDGVVLPRPRRVYFAINKPPGVVCTNNDPSGRTRVIDLIKSNDRLFTIGRLDRSSEGLILVTNDGELANLLTHPRYGIEKVYRVRVAGHPEPTLLRKLEAGIHLADGFARVASARMKRRTRDASELEIVLNEGRNREIRRLLARLGHKVLQLKRIALGPLRLEDMPSGAYRRLSSQEARQLRATVGRGAKSNGKQRPTPGKRKAAIKAKPTAVARTEPRPKRPRPAGRPSAPPVGTVLDFEEPANGAGRPPTKRKRPVKSANTNKKRGSRKRK